MHAFFETLVRQAQAWSLPEALGVALAILYLLLVIRQNIWCWFCAALSTAIYTYVMFDVRLYMEAALNVFYFAMAIYGWRVWMQGGAGVVARPVTRWAPRLHLIAILSIVLLSAATGYLLEQRTDAAFPYIDSLSTWGAIWATFLVARKVLENWWYWLVIDLTMAIVFWIKGLELTALLFVIYLFMIPFGMLSWSRSYREAAQ